MNAQRYLKNPWKSPAHELLSEVRDSFDTQSEKWLPSIAQMTDWIKRRPSLAREIAEGLVYYASRNGTFHSAKDTAARRLKGIITGCPERVGQIAAAVESKCRDRNRHRRLAATSLLKTVREACPDKGEEIFNVLLQQCRDSFSQVQYVAMSQLMDIAEPNRPEEGKRIASALLKLQYNNENVDVQCLAMKRLIERIDVWPDKVEEIVGRLLRWMKSWDEELRFRFCCMVGDTIGRFPHRDREIVDATFQGLEDAVVRVRLAALRNLAVIAKACPDERDFIASLLLELCNSISKTSKISAMKQVVESASMWPDRMDEVVEVVIRESDSGDVAVRTTATSLLGELIEVSPVRLRELVEAVIEKSNDEEVHVRRAATRIMTIAAKAFADRANEIVTRLQQLCNDRDNGERDSKRLYRGSVKEEALRQVVSSLAQSRMKSEEVVALVLDECHSVNPYIREAAVSQLGALAVICPDKSTQIVQLILAESNDEYEVTKQTAIQQSAKAAIPCPEQAEVLLKNLLRHCGGEDKKAKALAMAEVAQIARVCGDRAGRIVTVLLWGCTDEDETVSDAAKEHLEVALRACPEEAMEIVARMIQSQSREEVHTHVSSKRRSQSLHTSNNKRTRL